MTIVKALHQSGRVRIAVVIMLGNDRVDDLEQGLVVLDERKGDIVSADPCPKPDKFFPRLCWSSLLPKIAKPEGDQRRQSTT
jgi:hypothetical protein